MFCHLIFEKKYIYIYYIFWKSVSRNTRDIFFNIKIQMYNHENNYMQKCYENYADTKFAGMMHECYSYLKF